MPFQAIVIVFFFSFVLQISIQNMVDFFFFLLSFRELFLVGKMQDCWSIRQEPTSQKEKKNFKNRYSIWQRHTLVQISTYTWNSKCIDFYFLSTCNIPKPHYQSRVNHERGVFLYPQVINVVTQECYYKDFPFSYQVVIIGEEKRNISLFSSWNHILRQSNCI